MKFLTIKPSERKIDIFVSTEADPYNVLRDAVGLDTIHTDHGNVTRGLGIIVYEFGLLEPQHQDFFAIGKQLYQGNALIYRYDEAGEAEDVTEQDLKVLQRAVTFIKGRDTVEELIQSGDISRPQSTINGEVFWEWKA